MLRCDSAGHGGLYERHNPPPDAILDRLIHNAHKINLSMKGESMRKKYAGLT